MVPTSSLTTPLGDADLARLEHLLSSLPASLEPLDLSALDGYLCGVLLQPQRLPVSRWWPFVVDMQGREAPTTAAMTELQQLVLRRHAELDRAIGDRQWFDPWVLAGDEDAAQDDEGPLESDGHEGEAVEADGANPAEGFNDDEAAETTTAVLPWVAGFAAAMEHFPQLMDSDDPELVEPLAILFMHFDPADLEDADALLAMIETLEPPTDLATAVQDIVRALMLMADVTRPRTTPPRTGPRARKPGVAPRGDRSIARKTSRR